MQRAAILALISLATAANAQMGETKAELAHRYGPAMPWERMLTSEYSDLVDDACRFEHDGLKTLASFKRGKAGLLIYQKLDKSAMSKKEVSRPWRAQFTSRIGCSSLATVRIPAGAPATLRYSRIIFRSQSLTAHLLVSCVFRLHNLIGFTARFEARSHMNHPRPNQSLEPTAGRNDDQV